MSKKKLFLIAAAVAAAFYFAKKAGATAPTSSVTDGSKPGELDPKTFLPR